MCKEPCTPYIPYIFIDLFLFAEEEAVPAISIGNIRLRGWLVHMDTNHVWSSILQTAGHFSLSPTRLVSAWKVFQ